MAQVVKIIIVVVVLAAVMYIGGLVGHFYG
jgi:hypothetical protein